MRHVSQGMVAKHASDERATCPSTHLHVAETGNVLLSPGNICVSFATNFVARYKVSEVAKLGDTEGHQCRARHVS